MLIGSAISTLSVFLTWYKDLDKFNTGDSFLGITGPLYLAGLVFLVAAVASFGMVMARLMEKRQPQLPVRESTFHVITSSVGLFMLVMSLSVFFHSRFGINITEKQMGIGMILGFIGSGAVLIGGLLARRGSPIKLTADGHIEDRIQSGIGTREVRDSVAESVGEYTLDKNATVGELTDEYKETKEFEING